jgi:hypothetical protein
VCENLLSLGRKRMTVFRTDGSSIISGVAMDKDGICLTGGLYLRSHSIKVVAPRLWETEITSVDIIHQQNIDSHT